MGARPTSTDPRSQRSRASIVDALHRQALGGEVTSVANLSAAAGVTRATFYNHFDTLEEAAWHAILERFDHLLARAFAEREEGISFEESAIKNLGEIVQLMRTEAHLFHLADAHDNGSDLRGVAEIFRVQNRLVWKDNGIEVPTAEIEVTYAAAGLYAVLAVGAQGRDDIDQVARVAHSLLPEWMRRAEKQGAETGGLNI